MKQQWSFSALDTLFFKESRPMESGGGSQLASVFPPPARTLIGAVRTSIGEALGVDWREYASGDHPLHAIMGRSDTLGPLRFSGPYLLSHGERLFPAPLACLQSACGQTRLRPDGKATHCDLGHVYLPVKANPGLHGAKPLEQALITEAGLRSFLSGLAIAPGEIRLAIDLYVQEDRLGIARDNNRRVTGDGLLYQTRHIRPLHTVGLQMGVGVAGLDATHVPESGMARLGAEGRLAAWQRGSAPLLPVVARPANAQGLLLMLLTPALFDRGWLPDGFVPQAQADALVWHGELAGVRLRLISSVVGKPVREGGWDMVQRAPRPLASYAPVGSCYFCEVIDGDLQQAQAALHGLQIGQETEYGRGELAVGYW
jgi:CRISPR-associated protein Cmr3